MTKYLIEGGHPLHGTIEISGAKNAAVAIIPAALLVDGVCRIENVPQISDVTLILQILRELGADVRTINRTTVEIDCSHIRNRQVPYELARKIRASYYLVGALLGRFGWAEVPLPGGCNLGGRPIDQHIKGFVAMGAEVDVRNGLIYAQVPGRGCLAGGQVYLDIVSVGATMNIMLAAALAEGMTVIENAAKEPHIVDLANFLNSMGADIMGAGTDVIKVRGVQRLRGGSYSIIPDQIEAGTYMAAVAAAGGELLVKNVIPKHLDCISAKLVEMGGDVAEQDDAVLVTHEHTDHVSGLATLTKQLGVPVYATAPTLDRLERKVPALAQLGRALEAGTGFQLGELWVESFSTPHDAAGSVGYAVTGGGARMALATDLGHLTPQVWDAARGADLLVCETNHDEDWVRSGPYPYALKQRILGDFGHLSNEAGAELAGRAALAGTRTILLAHLSSENNTPARAREVVSRRLSALGVRPEEDITLAVAPRSECGALYRLERGGALRAFPAREASLC